MLLGSKEIFRVNGIPVHLHFTFLILLIMILYQGNLLLFGLIFPFAAFLALHELGHAIVAQRLGYRVDRIILTPIGGAAMVRLDVSKHQHESQIALAGPLVNLTLALPGLLIYALLQTLGWERGAWFVLIFWAVPNLMLGVFNLIPAFPMDGGRILRAHLSESCGAVEATRKATTLGKSISGAIALYSFYQGGFNLLIIAGLLYFAAGQEYRAIRQRTIMEQGFGAAPLFESTADFSMGPPPYETQTRRKVHSLVTNIREASLILWNEVRRILS